jgi:phosphate transport system substrate-binding protein
MSGKKCGAAAVLAFVIGASPALAEKVTLKSEDGYISVTGELISFENGFYTIRSNLGLIGVPASRVTCSGEACPDLTVAAAVAPEAAAPEGVAPPAEPSVAARANDTPPEPAPAPVVGAPVVTASADAVPAGDLPVYETYDPAEIDFSIKGSDTVGDELMPLLIKGAAESLGAVIDRKEVGERQSVHTALAAEGAGDPLFSVFLEDKGSSTSFKGLLDGSAEIGMSSRPVKPEEIEAFLAAGLGDPTSFEQEHAIAIDGLLIVVNPQNPVSGLSFDQVSRLLSGAIENWSELGGPDLPVTVHTRNTDSGTYATIVDTFLKPYDREMSPEANVVSGNAQLTDAVFADPGAIGYVGFAYQKDSKPVDIVADCGTAATPSSFSAKTGEYPLQRTLYLYHAEAALSPMAAALVDYATSDAATSFVEKSGFIGYNLEVQPMTRQAEILRAQIEVTTSPSELALMTDLAADMGEWDRLSSTFRFKTGSSRLENQSRRDLERLAAFIVAEGAGREFAFVGFTDSDGPVEANRRLGLARATAMRAELQAIMAPDVFAGLSIEVKGYGEINPVGCNTDFAGQRLNRRVEVWMR